MDDQFGAAYIADMTKMGLGFYGKPLKGGPATARSMIAVTPVAPTAAVSASVGLSSAMTRS